MITTTGRTGVHQYTLPKLHTSTLLLKLLLVPCYSKGLTTKLGDLLETVYESHSEACPSGAHLLAHLNLPGQHLSEPAWHYTRLPVQNLAAAAGSLGRVEGEGRGGEAPGGYRMRLQRTLPPPPAVTRL